MRQPRRWSRAGFAAPVLASFILVACVAIVGSPAPASGAPPGFAFLEVPTGARASALGGAYVTLARDSEAAFWNPAGLSGARGLNVSGGHAELYEKFRHDHFAVAGPMFGGGVGASIRALYSEPIEERDERGNLIGTFGAHDLEFGLAYGREAAPGFAVGASAQVVRERIANLAATTYAFGVGALWEPAWGAGLRFAASGQNLGPAAHYTFDGVEGEPVGLPAAFHTGVAHRVGLGGAFHLEGVVESRITRGRNGVGMAGAELGHVAGALLRFGVRVNDESSVFSTGAGYRAGGYQLDYAFVPLRLDLGESHRFAFRAAF